ncbi:MAG: S41 family peptidase [Betaproteobacteria bacterium]|jgi:C-terminal processing protease CtpA/Prc
MYRYFAIASFVCSIPFASASAHAAQEVPTDAASAYRIVEIMRNEAFAPLRTGNVTDAEFAAAMKKIDGVLQYLQTPLIRDLSNGDKFLRARRFNTLLEIARMHVQRGGAANIEKALTYLETAFSEITAPPLKRMLTSEPAFASLQNEPRFQALLQTLDATDRLWSVPSIATAYKEKLSVEERVAGLSLFWAEARQNFVHFDKVPTLAWDQLYLDTLKQVMAVETTRDYYEVLMKLAPKLRDGHTNIYPPKELSQQFYARPPLLTALIEGKVIVTRVDSVSLAKRVTIGDEVIAIDGQNVVKYAEEKVVPYASSSTPQDRDLRTYTYQLLSGDVAKSVALTLKDAHGKERVETVSRAPITDASDAIRAERFGFNVTPGGVAVISIDHFESDAGVKAFEKALPEIMKSNGLVIDLRRNGGGSTNFGLAILSYLTSAPIPGSASFIRNETALDRARGENSVTWLDISSNRPFVRKRDQIYTGPVAVLTSAQTFSAAEDFLVSYQMLKRGLTIGTATGGSTGQPLFIKLPGGGSGRICVKRDRFPDGREFVGLGIQPDIEVKRTVADVRAGLDAELARAIEVVLAKR